MTRQIQVPLATNTAEQDISGVERLINMYPRSTTGGKYKFNLIHTPGLDEFIELPTSPILALHNNSGRAFAVTPTKFYEIYRNGTFIELGDVDLSNRVVMEDNGNQVVMVDGAKGYYYDHLGGGVYEITDPAFHHSTHVAFQDGYFIFNRKDTGQFFISGFNDVSFDALDFATAEGQPDNLVAVLSDHRELFLFGTETIEVWYNSGAAAFPFSRNPGAFVEKGCGAPYSVAKQNNTVYFVGSDLIVYKMDGYTPVRISTHIVEESLQFSRLSDAFAYVYEEEGHLFYVLTIPEINMTWAYDITTAAWHIKRSSKFIRHQSNTSIFFDSKTLVGDYQSGKIFDMTRKVYEDDGEPIIREIALPTISKGRERLSINSFELDMESGVGLTTGQGSDPKAMLEVSKDGGKTWGNTKFANIGKRGDYFTRVKWNRFGLGRQFVFKINISDPIPLDIGGAFIEVD